MLYPYLPSFEANQPKNLQTVKTIKNQIQIEIQNIKTNNTIAKKKKKNQRPDQVLQDAP